MQCAGDIVLGPHGRRREQDRLLSSRPPITLVYRESEGVKPVTMLGAYSAQSDERRLTPPPAPIRPLDYHPEPAGAYFSWATLSNVQTAHTFHDDVTGLCKGVMLCYENGGSRALGQCRLLVDPRSTFTQPTRLCFQATTYLTSLRKWERRGVRVVFRREETHSHVGEDWKCLPLKGILKLSFTHDETYLSVEESLLSHDEAPG